MSYLATLCPRVLKVENGDNNNGEGSFSLILRGNLPVVRTNRSPRASKRAVDLGLEERKLIGPGRDRQQRGDGLRGPGRVLECASRCHLQILSCNSCFWLAFLLYSPPSLPYIPTPFTTYGLFIHSANTYWVLLGVKHQPRAWDYITKQNKQNLCSPGNGQWWQNLPLSQLDLVLELANVREDAISCTIAIFTKSISNFKLKRLFSPKPIKWICPRQ